MTQNWVAILGRIEYIDGVVRHIPTPAVALNDSTSTTTSAQSLVRSNIEFEQGTISIEAMIEDPDARCQIALVGPASMVVHGGLNAMGAAYGFCLLRDGQWEPSVGAGFGDKPLTNQWLELSLSVRGSNLELHFNGVKVAATTQRIQKGPVSLFMQSPSSVQVRNIQIMAKPRFCFVVMQFTEEYNALYKEVIKPTCELFGYTVVRADDFYTSGLIIDDITRSISESSLVIADVTPNNPNVFYEVGYAHGIGKPTILLSDRKRDRLPFDISGFRTLFYDNTIGGKSVVLERLTKHLESIEA